MKRLLSVFLFSVIYVLLCCSGCGLKTNDDGDLSTFKDIALPSYYTEYMNSKIKQINYNKTQNEINESFIFITDLHWDCNAGCSPMLVKYIQATTDVDKVIFGGDYISTDYDTAEQSLGIMSSCINSFDLKNYYAILGNHDTNKNNGLDTAAIPFSESMKVISGGNQSEPYYKIDSSDFCFIFLNTNDFKVDSEQYNWLCNQLTSMSEDKTVLIFMHEYYYSQGKPLKVKRNNNGTLIDELMENCASEIKCSIAAIFTGHIHHDYFSYNNYGCPAVATTCDGVGVRSDNDEYYRERGTFTEQAFDVVQIDKNNRRVLLTRIGAGSDRAFSY